MSSVTTPHYKIVEYWKDKLITKDGKVITWKDYNENYVPNAELVVCDLGEPSCWACGEPAKEWKESNYDKWLENGDFKSIWESKTVKHNLNRCHIVPSMLGGEDSPDNLFLLCENCHHLSPDTKNYGTFIRWVYRTRKKMCSGMPNLDTIMEHVNEELSSRDLPNAVEILKIMHYSNKRNELENKVKNDRLFEKSIKENTGMHGYGVSDSSIYGSIADVFEKLFNEVVNHKQ